MFSVFATLCVLFAATESVTKHPLMMVLSFDGFRPDYITSGRTPNLARLQKASASPPYIRSVFPTKTFVNHFSMATGLYAEDHGVLDSTIFDENYEILDYSYELFHYDESVVPIWTQNENTGNERYSGVMMWPGGEFPYQGKQPSYYEKLDMKKNWNTRIDTLMTWITNKDKPANLVLAYFEEPDYTAHRYGAEAKEVIENIIRVDNIVKYLLDSIKVNKLENILNLVILSDHGMTTVPYDKMVFLDNFLSKSLYKLTYAGPSVFIYPNPGKMDEVYNKLKKGSIKSKSFNVYKPEEMPDRWCMKNSPRLNGLLYILSEPNYSIWNDRLSNMLKKRGKDNFQIGCHGYDNIYPEMRALFMASGPIFKKSFTAEPFDNINLYKLISHVMDLDKPEGKVQPRGSLSDVTQLLSSGFKTGSSSNVQHSPKKDTGRKKNALHNVIMFVMCITNSYNYLRRKLISR